MVILLLSTSPALRVGRGGGVKGGNGAEDFRVEKLFSVKDYVCVITGGGSGIGLMAAQALAANGTLQQLYEGDGDRIADKLNQVLRYTSRDVERMSLSRLRRS